MTPDAMTGDVPGWNGRCQRAAHLVDQRWAAEGSYGMSETRIVKPTDLKKIADDMETAKAKEALERHRKE